MRRITLILLCSVGLWGCGAAGRYLGPTAHGYSFHASAVPNEIFLPSDQVSQENFPSTATLLVQVHDVNDKPVESVPVTFQFTGSECQGVVTLSAQRAVTAPGAGVDHADHRQHHGLLSDCGARGQRHAGAVGCCVVSTRSIR